MFFFHRELPVFCLCLFKIMLARGNAVSYRYNSELRKWMPNVSKKHPMYDFEFLVGYHEIQNSKLADPKCFNDKFLLGVDVLFPVS